MSRAPFQILPSICIVSSIVFNLVCSFPFDIPEDFRNQVIIKKTSFGTDFTHPDYLASIVPGRGWMKNHIWFSETLYEVSTWLSNYTQRTKGIVSNTYLHHIQHLPGKEAQWIKGILSQMQPLFSSIVSLQMSICSRAPWIAPWTDLNYEYRKVSNIGRTKSQNVNASRLIL